MQFSIIDPNLGTDKDVSLCTEHYKEWYRFINPIQNKWKTCGRKISLLKSRSYPNLTLFQIFLEEHMGFTGTIDPNHKICNTCYKSHLITVQHIKQAVTSKNSDLAQVIDEIKKNDIVPTANIHVLEQAIMQSVHLAALLVGKVILNNTAILLPEVYSYFKETLMDITKQCNISMDSDLEMNYSSVWLRSQVSLMLELSYRYGGGPFTRSYCSSPNHHLP